MKKLLIITLALLAAGSLQADTIVQTHNIATHGPGSGLSPWTDSWTFNKFDTQGGDRVLNSVQVFFNIQAWGGWLGADNDSPTETATGDVSQDVNGELTSDLVLLNASNQNIWADLLARNLATFNLAINEGSGDGDSSYDEGGADWDRLDGPTEANAISTIGDDYIRDLYKTDYIGSGTFGMAFSSEQSKNEFTEGYVNGGFGPQQAKGSVTVTYDYTVVPEPATASMMLFVGGLGFLIRRHFVA